MHLIAHTPIPYVFAQIPQKPPFAAATEIAQTVSAKGKWIILRGGGSIPHHVAEALKHISLATRSAQYSKDKKFKGDADVVVFKDGGVPLGIAYADQDSGKVFVHVHNQQTKVLPRGYELGRIVP